MVCIGSAEQRSLVSSIQFRRIRSWYRLHRLRIDWEFLLGRAFVMRFYIARNTLLLAPDRFLTVLGVIAAFLYPFFGTPGPNDLERLAFWITTSAAISFFTAHYLCRKDPQLYSRIVTVDVPMVSTLYHIAGLASGLIDDVLRSTGSNKLELIGEQQNVLSIIDESKILLSERFNLDRYVFCDQFLRFSPVKFEDRGIKLGLNQRFINELLIRKTEGESIPPEEESYCETLTQQSASIVSWLEDTQTHLLRIRNTQLEFRQIEALFLTASTSGAVQRLAYILQNESPSHEDLRLLFELLSAFRGRSLFRRLTAITIANAESELNASASEAEKSEVERVFKARMQILLAAASDDTEHQESTDRIYAIGPDRLRVPPRSIWETWQHLQINHSSSSDSAGSEEQPRPPGINLRQLGRRIFFSKVSKHTPSLLANWWQSSARYIYGKRQDISNEFDRQLHKQWLSKLEPTQTLYIVVDSYSRAVRTALRLLPDTSNVRVFVLTQQKGQTVDSARLLHHVVEREDWENKKRKSELLSGDITLLQSLVRKGDRGIHLIGAASIGGPTMVYTTARFDVSEDVKKCFGQSKTHEQTGQTTLNYSRIALVSSYKLNWTEFLKHRDSRSTAEAISPLAEEDGGTAPVSNYDRIYAIQNDLGVTDDSLLYGRDSMTGGLYALTAHLISDLAIEQLERLFAAREARDQPSPVELQES